MTARTYAWATATGWLAERCDFLHVHAVRSVRGDGWDVVLRVDGTYAERADAEAVAAWLREAVTRGELLTDIPRERLAWWAGPPELVEASR